MAEALSKSAKKRAAKQARDAAHEGEVPAAPVPEPKKEESKPKEQPKAKAAAAPKAAAAAPKVAEKAAEQPKAKAEAKKSAAKKKEKEVVAAAPPKKDSDPNYHHQVDDGTGDSWETAAGVSKKNQKRKEKKDEDERKQKELEIEKLKAAKAAQKAGGAAQPAPYTGVVDKSGMTATQAAIARARELANAPSSVPVASVKDGEKKEEEVKTNFITATVTVPEDKIGRIIGPQGKNLKCIQEKTGVHKIDTDSGVFTISGEDANQVAQAELAIKEMVEKGYMSLAYDNFLQIEVMANPSTFPDLIGKGGCVIMAMKKELEVEISIPAVPKNAPPSNKKYPISVAGSKDNTEKAKDVIESIINYYHHEITHPGLAHVEMEVEQWAYSFIIGKAGSEMRHIQKNWDVKVYIPREHSANQSVVVVGQKKDCDAAKKYMEKQIADAGEKKNTDSRQDKPDDHWGKEEPEEAWMKQHMYVRK